MKNAAFIIAIITTIGCNGMLSKPERDEAPQINSAKTIPVVILDTSMPVRETVKNLPSTATVHFQSGFVPPDSITNFAQSLIGVRYKYGSVDPSAGFDCSGFITYVFNHFNIEVPRSSIDFTNVGKPVAVMDAKKGDLILFTGTDSTAKFVGHMGIVLSNDNGNILFIHSSSGKANGVVITPLNNYYKGRFVKIIRVFPANI